MEHRNFPFYGVQFHPEKNLFEWVKNRNISHTANAVLQAQYFTNFFVSEARKNFNRFDSTKEEQKHLIYNFPTTFTASLVSSFQECFLFEKDVDYLSIIQKPVSNG
jgi:gamma-glutamyl hydrolase